MTEPTKGPAQIASEAWGRAYGPTLPSLPWDAMPEEMQGAWRAAARAVFFHFEKTLQSEPRVRDLLAAARLVLTTLEADPGDTAIAALAKALEPFSIGNEPPAVRARLAGYSFSVGRENGVTRFYVNGDEYVPVSPSGFSGPTLRNLLEEKLERQAGEITFLRQSEAKYLELCNLLMGPPERNAFDHAAVIARLGCLYVTAAEAEPAHVYERGDGEHRDSETFSFAEALMRMRQGRRTHRIGGASTFFMREGEIWVQYLDKEERLRDLGSEALNATDWIEVAEPEEKPLVGRRNALAMRAIADLLGTLSHSIGSIEYKIAGVSVVRKSGGNYWLWLPDRRGERRANPLDAARALLDLAELAEK